MARTRKPKILDQTIAETPDGPLEVAPEAPQADLPTKTDGPIQDRTSDFVWGVQKTYKLPTGAKRTDN